LRIVEQSAEIITTNAVDPLPFLEMCGRTAYKSYDKISEGSDKRFVEMLIKNGHESVLEHLVITLRLVTSRGVMAELTRHRMASFTVQSTRYVSYEKEIPVILPMWLDSSTVDQEVTWENAIYKAEQRYKELLVMGRKPEDARGVLPNDLATEIVMTANARELRHILKLRTAKGAHPDMRCLMYKISAELDEYCPEVFSLTTINT